VSAHPAAIGFRTAARFGLTVGNWVLRPQDFKRWRKSLDLSQKEAAEALGLKRRVVQYYEKGERDGEKVKIPKTVRLACFALASGVRDYRGPARKIVMSELSSAAKGESEVDEEETDEASESSCSGDAVEASGEPVNGNDHGLCAEGSPAAAEPAIALEPLGGEVKGAASRE